MKQKLTALALSFVMILSMTKVAFAAETPAPPTEMDRAQQDATVAVYKNLAIAEGITVPDTSFAFEIASLTHDAPKATVAPIVYTSADTQVSAKAGGAVLHNIEKESPIHFEPFPHAGVFEYKVKEMQGTHPGMEYSDEEYLLRVYAANREDKDGGVFVRSFTAQNNKNEKQPKIVFTNIYRKDASLEILKQTSGAFADKTKSFDFTIQFTKSAISDASEFVGTIDGKTLTCQAGEPVPFQLHHGQKLVFSDLPVGTRYIVTEKGVADGYTPQVTVMENGVQSAEKQGTEAEDLNSSAENSAPNLVGENSNLVTFENKYHEIPITGVILNNLPFIILIGSAVLAFVLLTLLKRRKPSERG